MGRVSADRVKIAPAWGWGKAITSRSANAIRPGSQADRDVSARVAAPGAPHTRVPLLSHVNRIPDEWKGSPGLAAMLGPKAEQHDAAFAHANFGECDSIPNFVFAQ
jgi:hypothetical protein